MDLGCNTGHYSRISAESGAKVVAVDSDPAVIDRLWLESSRLQLDILPLVINVARPSPAIGWRNSELDSFLERARTANFDAVYMLAIVHHLLVSERIPLDDIFELAAGLTTRHAVIEFIGPADSMLRRILRGREALFLNYSAGIFRDSCQKYFRIVRAHKLPGSDRELYLLEKK